MLRETPLCDVHKKLGARVIEFGGWNMPLQYTTIIDEHTTTRTKAGVFDTCHMGEFIVSGENAKAFLQKICLNDVEKLISGKCQYSMFCKEDGGVVDDIFVYQLKENEYMLVTNAVTIDKDHRWMLKHKVDSVEIENISDKTAKLDLQGPLAEEILQSICDFDLRQLKRFYHINVKVDNIDCRFSRTGYTAEDGFELYFDAQHAKKIWNKLLEVGGLFGLKPAGLGARDTLRIEACYSLYGHELNDNITPVEASLGWMVREYKKDFIGSEVICKHKKEGSKIVNVAFEMIDKAIPREHYKVFKDNEEIGEVSSGTFSPTFKKGIGMAFFKTEFSKEGSKIYIMVRGRKHKAIIVKKPFYRYRGKGKFVIRNS